MTWFNMLLLNSRRGLSF